MRVSMCVCVFGEGAGGGGQRSTKLLDVIGGEGMVQW